MILSSQSSLKGRSTVVRRTFQLSVALSVLLGVMTLVSPAASADGEVDESISTESVSCPSSTGVNAGDAKTTYAGKVVENFDFTKPVVGATVTVFVDQTKNICVLTNASGQFSVDVPDSWKASSMVAVDPPEAKQDSLNFADAMLPQTGTTLHVSLPSYGCPGAGGYALNENFVTISGTVNKAGPTGLQGARVTAASGQYLGLICASTAADGSYTMKVPTSWGPGVMMTADPPATETTLGSKGGATAIVDISQNPLSTLSKDFLLDGFGFGATLNVSLNGTPVADVSKVEAVVCLYSSSNVQGTPVRCGGGRVENGSLVVKISTTQMTNIMGQAATASHYGLQVVAPTGAFKSNTGTLIPSPATGLTIPVTLQGFGGGGNQQPDNGGGNQQPDNGGGNQGPGNNDGCSAGQTPNIVGTVTNDGAAYAAASVELKSSNNNPLPGWAADGTNRNTTTSATGEFGFCFVPQEGERYEFLQVVVSPKDFASTIGSSVSATKTPAQCATSCTMNVAMGQATVKGTITGAGEVEIVQPTQTGPLTLARVMASGGQFAVAYPFVAQSFYSISGVNYDPANELVPFKQTLQYTGAALNVNGAMETPNLKLDALKPDGSSFAQSDPWLTFYLVTPKVGETCPPNSSPMTGPLAGQCSATLGQKSAGTMVAKVSDGTWTVSVEGQQYPRALGTVVVSGNGSTLAPNSPITLVTGRLKFPLSAGNVKFAAVSATGSPVSGATVRVNKWDVNAGYFNWSPIVPAALGGGKFGWSPTEAGIYQLTITPGAGDVGYAETDVYVEVTGSGATATIAKTCTYVPSTMGASPDCSGGAPTKVGDEFQLVVLGSNFEAQLCAPDPGDGSCPNPGSGNFNTASVEVFELVDYGQYVQDVWTKRAEVSTNVVKLRLEKPSTGTRLYKLRAQPPYGNPNLWANVTVVVKVNDSGAMFRCTSGTVNSVFSECASEVALTATSGVYNWGQPIRFASAKVVAEVKKPASCVNNCTVQNSWVSVQKEVPSDRGGTMLQWMGGTTTNNLGRAAFNLDAGTYRLSADPPWGEDSGLTAGYVTIVVDASGDVTTVNGAAHTAGQPVVLRLREPNVVGTIRAGGQSRGFVNVNVEKWNAGAGFWEWQPIWGNADRNGEFRLSLENGKWRLNAYPQGDDSGQYTEARLMVEISGDVITKVGDCVLSAVACVATSGPISLDFGTPNVSGTIKRNTGSGLVNVAQAGIGITKWLPDKMWWEWNTWTNAGSGGRFGIQLGEGLYQLSIEPWGISGDVVRTTRTLKVPATGAGKPCYVTSVETPTCTSAALADGSYPLDITLDGPNLKGVVKGNGQVQAGWVYAEKWNADSSWFEWTNSWADARPGSGTFGFVLGNGTYRVTAEPRPGSGFAKGFKYVKVAGQQWCQTTLGANGAPNDCVVATPAADLEVTLPGSNVVGVAKYDDDGSANTPTVGLRDGWVEVLSEDGSGSVQWEASTGLNFNGSFSLRLETKEGSSVTKYRVVVSPASWNNPRNLGKKRVNYWVGDFDADGIKDDVCPQEPTNHTTCGAALVTGTQTFDMGGGNVSGTATQPNGSTPVANSDVTVEKRVTKFGWTYWEWTDNWTRSNNTGKFALSLEAGKYKVTARPEWGSASYSPASQEIQVLPNETWCLSTDYDADSDCDTVGTNLLIALKQPNISAQVVKAGDVGVRDAWVSIEAYREFDSDDAGTEPDWTWWEWTGNGINTTNTGNFSLNVAENGRYRITVSPPWNDASGQLSRFSKEFVVSDGGASVDWDFGTAGVQALANGKLAFPAPNVSVVVKAGGTALRDAWVYVERKVTFDPDGAGGPNPPQTWWEWLDISGQSNGNGKVAILVPSSGANEEYRLVVNPPWNRDDLSRFYKTFSMSSGGAVTGVEVDEVLNFPTSNVSGKVKINATDNNSFGWVEVRNASNEIVAGLPLNGVGDFSTYLATGTYTLRMYANYGLSSALPIDVEVVIAADGSLSSWRYLPGGTNQCPAAPTPCTITARLDNKPANVKVEVHVAGVAKSGAFVRLTKLVDTDAGEGVTWEPASPEVTYDFVTGSDGTFSANVPAGTYKVNAVYTVGGVKVGELATVTVPETANPLTAHVVTVVAPG